MERKFLEDLGLDKDRVDKAMAQYGKDIEAHKAATERANNDRDTYKGQLDEVSKQLKAFDGVDVAALRGEVDKLKADLTAKDTEHKAQLADRDFQGHLTAGIMAAKGKNPKAIAALLDTDKLKTSKNQKEDIAAAIKTLAESDAYLFGESTPGFGAPGGTQGTPAKVSTGAAHDENGGGASTNTSATMNNMIRGASKGD